MRTLACLALAAALAPPLAAQTLEERVAPLAQAHKGKIAVSIKNLTTGESYTLNADEAMPTASLIKFPIMVETYWLASEGKVSLDQTVTLKADDKVQGSGILTDHFSAGATFPLRDAVRLMIRYSDNTATNLVLDAITIPATNERMGKIGLPNTKINAKVFKGSTTSVAPERTKKFGLGSTTANEMVALLAKLQANELGGGPEACKAMLAHLRTCDDDEKLPRFLPPAAKIAHKTGSVNASRTDAGIITTPAGPVAVCVLTDENEDRRWVADNAAQVVIAKIGRAVYDHFAPAKKPDAPAEK